MSEIITNVKYEYGNLQIPGGGYVTGFAFHPEVPGILYCRTDIGGCYKYDFENDEWQSLVEHVTHFDMSETFPLAIALDKNDPALLYVACGVGHPAYGSFPNGYFCTSKDYGKTFEIKEMPCHVHGNNVGRGSGTRLVVDPSDSSVIYFASQEAGLIRSSDRGETWEEIKVSSKNYPENETHLTFVWVAPDGKTIVASASGLSNRGEDGSRGHSLYVSYDRGASFSELTQPAYGEKNDAGIVGYVGHRYDFDGKYLYVTFTQTGPYAYMAEPGYSCSGGDVTEGRVLRYEYNSETGLLGEPKDITPVYERFNISKDYCQCGFGGISSTPQLPGYLLVSTICSNVGDMVFESRDYGESWTLVLYNLEVGNMHFNAPYMKPEYNGGGSLIHWLSDIKINPFDANMAFFNTGTGVFGTTNLQAGKDMSWSDHCKGIEETVHLNVYAPVKGDIIALDIVGDLGGFVFTELDKPCENSFADEENNRYITSINADYSDYYGNIFAATPRGNWKGKTCGGVVYSEDAGKTLRHCAMPYGFSEEIDRRLDFIKRPNVNSGWIAMSPDTCRLVWAIADLGTISADCVVYSEDKGVSFKKSEIFDIDGKNASGNFKPFFDRTDDDYCYGFGEDSRMYVSKDGGKTFHERKKPDNMPAQQLAGIDAQCVVEIRGVAGEFGTFMFAMNVDGLWKITYDKASDEFKAEKLSSGKDAVYCVGLGILPDTDEYVNNDKALYVCAIINDIFGFFRSFDYGKTWEKLNDKTQMFGEIKSIDADKKVFGRYFIATGTRGLKYGVQADLRKA
jgi:hypothetical protein